MTANLDFEALAQLAQQYHPTHQSLAVNQSSLDAIIGRDLATLNKEERALFDGLMMQGRKHGVVVTIESDAPKEELKLARSSDEYQKIIEKHPNLIKLEFN